MNGDRQTERQTDRQTDRWMDEEISGQSGCFSKCKCLENIVLDSVAEDKNLGQLWSGGVAVACRGDTSRKAEPGLVYLGRTHQHLPLQGTAAPLKYLGEHN